MSYQRLAYDDAAPATEMAADCRAVEAALRLPQRRSRAARAEAAALRPAPSIRYDDYPQDVKKQEIAVSEAAARLAAALHLSLD
jgi:hypothetical protein